MSSDEDEASAHLVAAVRLAEAGATARAAGDEKKAKKRYRKAVKQAAAACTSGAAAAAALAEDLLTRVEHDAPAEELPELRTNIEDLDDAATALAEGGVCLLEECVHVTEAGGMMQAVITLDLVGPPRDQYGDDARFSFKEAARRCEAASTRGSARAGVDVGHGPKASATGAHLSRYFAVDWRGSGADAKLAWASCRRAPARRAAARRRRAALPGDNLPAHASVLRTDRERVRAHGPDRARPGLARAGPGARALETRCGGAARRRRLLAGAAVETAVSTSGRCAASQQTTTRPSSTAFARPWFRGMSTRGRGSTTGSRPARRAKKKKRRRAE